MDIVCEFTESFKRAVAENDISTAADCLKDGINPDIRKPGCLTPLMVAVKNSSIDMLKLLLEYEPNIDLKSPGGTALIIALKHKNLTYSHQQIIDELIFLNPDLSKEDRYGHNAIYYAIKNAHIEVSKKLIEAGAFSMTDSNGLKPIHYALKYENIELAGKLFLLDPLPVKNGEVLKWLLHHFPERVDELTFASVLCDSFPSKYMAYDYVKQLIDHKIAKSSDLNADLFLYFLLYSDLRKNKQLFDLIIDYDFEEEAIAVLLNAGVAPTEKGLKKLQSSDNARIQSWLNPLHQSIRGLLIEGRLDDFYQELINHPEILEQDFIGTRALFADHYETVVSYFMLDTKKETAIFINNYENHQREIESYQKKVDEIKAIIPHLWDIPLDNRSNLMLDAVFLRNYDALERILELSDQDKLGEYYLRAFDVVFDRNDVRMFDILMKSPARFLYIEEIYNKALEKEKSNFLVQLFPLLPESSEIDVINYLDVAVKSKNMEMAEQILESDRLSEVKDEDIFLNLVLTVSSNILIVEQLFKSYPIFNHPSVRSMVLADALTEGNYDTVELLIRMGTKPNMHYRSLKHLINNGDVEMLKKYIRNGLWYCRDEFDQLPISEYARLQGQIEMARLFRYTEENIQEFTSAIKNNESQVVERLLQNGFMLNNDLTRNRIHIDKMFQNNHRYMLSLLFEYGIDTRGHNELMLDAISQKQAKLASKLLENGIETRTETSCEGKGWIQRAYFNNDIEMMKVLIRSDPILMEAKDENGESLISLSIKNKDIKMVQFLLEMGADPNHQNKNGQAPLDIAMESFQLEIIKLLSDYGANISS